MHGEIVYTPVVLDPDTFNPVQGLVYKTKVVCDRETLVAVSQFGDPVRMYVAMMVADFREAVEATLPPTLVRWQETHDRLAEHIETSPAAEPKKTRLEVVI